MENVNGLFLFFHTLEDPTYHEIDAFLKSLAKKKSADDSATISDTKSDTKEYTSYTKSDFPDQESLNSKLKYSNKEKNIIKRQRYDDYINNESNENIYQKFSVDPKSDPESSPSCDDLAISKTEPICVFGEIAPIIKITPNKKRTTNANNKLSQTEPVTKTQTKASVQKPVKTAKKN